MLRILFLVLLSSQVFAQTNVEKAKKLWEEKKNVEAKKILTAIDDDSKEYAEAQYYLGRIAFDEKKYEDAADFYEEAIAANDKVAEYYVRICDAYGQEAENASVFTQIMLVGKLQSAMESAVALNPNLIDIKIKLCQFYTDVPGLMGGDIDKAKVLAQQLLKQKPDEGYRRMGDIYVKEEKLKEAEAEYFKMIKSNPEQVSVLAKYYMKQKQYDKAYSYYEEAIKKNAEDFNSMYQIGKISALTGQRLNIGEDYLKKFLNHQPTGSEPSHAEANMRLGQIYEDSGNKAEAKRLFQLALKQDSDLDEAEAGLERLK